jgi:hypothetical protein
MSAPPLSDFKGHLKRIRIDSLNPLELRIFEFLFSGFFWGSKPNAPEEINEYLQRTGLEGSDRRTEEPYVYRRFAGGAKLPRGRYATVCDDRGRDGDTLICELMAYAWGFGQYESDSLIRRWDGFVVDSADAWKVYEADFLLRKFFGPRLPPQTILVKAFFDYGCINVSQEVINESRKDGGIRLALPYQIEEATIPDIIDLRNLRTQVWLHQQLKSGLAPLLYDYFDDGKRRRHLILDDEEPMVQPPPPPGTSLETYAPRRPWQERDAIFYSCNSFVALLPYLMCDNQGGSPITEALGRWFRKLGANGLIYPSPRSDVYCINSGRTRVSFGFCFVDYRGIADDNHAAVSLIRLPQAWINPDFVTEESKITFRIPKVQLAFDC